LVDYDNDHVQMVLDDKNQFSLFFSFFPFFFIFIHVASVLFVFIILLLVRDLFLI
jgi:hypothetical protein